MTTVAIIGADGQLGTDLLAAFELSPEYSIVPLTIDDMNIVDFAGTRSTLRMNGPHIVINTAAYHRVDDCELFRLRRRLVVRAALGLRSYR